MYVYNTYTRFDFNPIFATMRIQQRLWIHLTALYALGNLSECIRNPSTPIRDIFQATVFDVSRYQSHGVC